MVEDFAALVRAPARVSLEQLEVQFVKAAGGADVERVLADLPDRGDPSEGKEEPEAVREVGVGAGDGPALFDEVVGFEPARRDRIIIIIIVVIQNWAAEFKEGAP